AYCWRGRGAVRQGHRNAGSRHHFTRVLGKLCGKEASVVTHHKALCRVTLLADVLRDGFGDALHVRKGKILRDYTAPSIGAELNLIQHTLPIVVDPPGVIPSEARNLALPLRPEPDSSLRSE